MTSARNFTSLALGVLLAVAALKGAACSGIDPNPPDPHLTSDPDPSFPSEFKTYKDAGSDADAGEEGEP